MIQNKKGLSTIVTTLIIILLVLVAIGIVWVVVRGVIEEGTSEIDIKVKCIDVNVKATVVDCTNPAACSVTLERGAGGDVIGGAMLVFYEENTAMATPYDSEGDISALGSKTVTPIDSGLTTPDRIEVTAYFTDDQGNDQLCSQATTFSF